MKTAFLVPLTLLGCAACDLPKDPDGTHDRIRAERTFKVGVIASGPPIGANRQQLFLDNVAGAAGARPALQVGAAEPLLRRLEEGALDLVIGPMSPGSPWSSHVTILPPLGEQVSRTGHVHVVAAARNGENRWISLLHREARKVASVQ